MMPVSTELCHITTCRPCLASHAMILQRLFALKDSAQARKTHFFAGRYENIYLERDSIPALAPILDLALAEAAKLLQCQTEQLQLGFWFNLMQQNDVTLPHTHDDNDELLSGTYYLQIPPGSGELLLQLPSGLRRIDPVEGDFVFFHPRIEHEVSRHVAAVPRISLGMNFGPKS
jgi:hypothetical protein